MLGIEPRSPAYEADELPLLYIASLLATYGKNTLPRHPVRDVLFGRRAAPSRRGDWSGHAGNIGRRTERRKCIAQRQLQKQKKTYRNMLQLNDQGLQENTWTKTN